MISRARQLTVAAEQHVPSFALKEYYLYLIDCFFIDFSSSLSANANKLFKKISTVFVQTNESKSAAFPQII